ncbi:MAG: calcium-binding protein, partial [Gammaproteobacteria bacterium]|nr:calcium-binding protein [Gammaproteobacteria bacterium]
LTGGSGDDWLAGGAGADILRGGSGDDALFFDARDDVHGGSGQDVGVVSGDEDIDLSMGRMGLEMLHSGDGNDRLSGFDSAQGVIIDGGGGDDTMRGSHQRDVLSGGAGDDYIKGHKGEDVVLGGAGDDRLEGNRGDDLVYGGAGNDRLYGLIDDDRLFGGAGNDDLDGGYGDDRLEGGAGSDTYSFTYSDFGSDTIRDSGGNDTVNIMGRRHEDVWLSRHGDDLRISVLGAEDEVLVEGQFGGAGNQIETLAAGQWGTVVTSAGRSVTEVVYDEKGPHFVSIDALVNAMAAFDKPQTGWSEMSSRERANVDAAWSAVGVWKYPEGGATLSTTLVTVAA